MSDARQSKRPADQNGPARASTPLRFATATSIFDGHDVAINIIRRVLQDQGAEVVHLGHNRSVDDIVRAALQEDVDGIAVSSYQGGHVEFFRYLIDSLKAAGAHQVRVFGGGGGTITPEEAAALESYGVEKVYTPNDGRVLGLEGMGQDMLQRTRGALQSRPELSPIAPGDHRAIGQWLSLIERGGVDRDAWTLGVSEHPHAPVVGITGTGGAGKSSLMDELLQHFLHRFPRLMIAVLAMDPTRYKSGGALLGDRIRLNSLADQRVYLRSLATRRRDLATSANLAACVDFLRSRGFGLVLVETAGTGQADVEIVDLVDLSLYVMTSDYGAQSQLEKIQMLDYADVIALNKFDKQGGQDALRDIQKQWRRNHQAFDLAAEQVPVYPTVASRWRDPGIQSVFDALCTRLANLAGPAGKSWTQTPQIPQTLPVPAQPSTLIPSNRTHYLSEISERGTASRHSLTQQVKAALHAQGYYLSLGALEDPLLPEPLDHYAAGVIEEDEDALRQHLRRSYEQALAGLSAESLELLRHWPETAAGCRSEQYTYAVRGKQLSGANYHESLSHLRIPKVAVPQYESWAELLRFLLQENLPGHYPYTAGVFPYRRSEEEPARMFAGEGTPERTNRRFHYLAQGQQAKRLSTAFDPITLYGEDADPRPDIYGRIGMSGVSITNLDDMKKLYSGFNLCQADTSVSMTINGPAPILLAWFINTAIDQQIEKYLREIGEWGRAEQTIAACYQGRSRPLYQGPLPAGHDRLGLGLLGMNGEQVTSPETYARIRQDTLAALRGTLQADILKEDQAQNECIFPLEFALRMMGDVQEYFIANQVRNYYSVSVSGYHIAEAGANPVTQLAFTLANGFTLVEYYLARGMPIDAFAAHMSFFFSNGMDPEYAVIGRVARRIWARAMRDVYHADARSQKLKYHIQTSGRTLHAQTLGYNDIRTTLQALYALYDNCNSLHTNAYDEALTTPTEESVRRALAIQMIINHELGLNYNQNPLQGSYIIEQLTDLVEQAVYEEFDRLAARGGVMGAMESLYQRAKIQDESLHYERHKHDGSLPIIGVNTFRHEELEQTTSGRPLTRSADAEKRAQITAIELYKAHHAGQASQALARLQDTVLSAANIFAELLTTTRHCTLGQITHALYEVTGRYRRRV